MFSLQFHVFSSAPCSQTPSVYVVTLIFCIYKTSGGAPSSGRDAELDVIFRKLADSLLAVCFYAGFLLRLFFDPEDGSDMFLRNVG
jgi:hypothetical protein